MGVDRRHVVEDGEQRGPKLNGNQRGHIAGEDEQRRAARREKQQQNDEGKDRVAHRFGHVTNNRQCLLRDLGAVDPGGVLRSDGRGAAGGQHHAGRIVDLLAAHLPGVVDRVDHRVLADQVSRRGSGRSDLTADVGLRDLVDHCGLSRERRKRRVQSLTEASGEVRDLRRETTVDRRVHGIARVGGHAGCRGDDAETRRVGGAHRCPEVGRRGEGGRRDGAVGDVVGGAVADEVDEVGANCGVRDGRATSLLDESTAEHQAVLLIGELGRKSGGSGKNLKRGFEEFGNGVADGARQATERSHAEGHVGDDAVGRAASLVDDAHGHPGHEQHAINEHDGDEPLPALKLLGLEHVGDHGRDEPAERHGSDGAQVGVGGHDRGDRVEDAGQRLRVVIGVDLPHGRVLEVVMA